MVMGRTDDERKAIASCVTGRLWRDRAPTFAFKPDPSFKKIALGDLSDIDEVPQVTTQSLFRVVCHERRLSATVRNCTRDEGGPFEEIDSA